MSRSCASVCRPTQFLLAFAAAALAAFEGPPSSIGQDARTVAVRGIVVDEAEMPVANARVAAHPLSGQKIEAAAPTGEFAVNVPAIGNDMLLSAQDATGELHGIASFRARQTEPIRITLRKAREVVVSVTDAARQPIAGARVGLILGTGFLPQGAIAEHLTDETGRAVLRCPAEARLQSVFAVKRDVGVNFNPLTVGQVEPQTIVLGDGPSFQIRVTDDEDKPLAGVSVHPNSINKGQGSLFSVRDFDELRTTTDGAGLATIHTLPGSITGRILFDLGLSGYAVISGATYDPRTAPKEITATLAPVVTLRGKVVGPDGQPPVRTEIVAAGVSHRARQPGITRWVGWQAGREATSFRAMCDDNGAFELPVARNHYYAIIASSNPRVAHQGCIVSPIQTCLALADSPREPLLLTLGPGTRIYGTATRTLNRTQSVPAARTFMRLLWQDAESYAKLPANQWLPGAKDDSPPLTLSLVQDAQTDADGQFEFFMPPGKYSLSAVTYGGDPVAIEVTDQKELKVDFHSTGLPPGLADAVANRPQPDLAKLIELSGRVVLEADRERGIPDVTVRRIDIGSQIGPRRATSSPIETTSNNGSFKMTRVAGESLLLASTSDGLLSNMIKIPATATEATIPLVPTATFRGRLIDGQTKKPLAGREINTMIRTDQLMSTSLSAYAITDASGEFALTGLPPGWPINVAVVTAPRSSSPGAPAFAARSLITLKSITAQKPQLYELGDLVPREAQQPSLEQIIASVTRSSYSPTGRMETALGQADLLGQRVLVFASASASDVCQRFFTLWYGLNEPPQNPALAELINQYILLALDTTPMNRRPVTFRAILDRSKLKLPAIDDAGLAIVQADGEVIATTTGGDLSSDGTLDNEKLLAFLHKHAPMPASAAKLLDDALADAKSTGKRVLVFQSVPFSAPSALLSLFLENQKALLAKDYVCIELAARHSDREAALRRAGGTVSTTPWIAVLDDTGKPLATTSSSADTDPPGVADVAKVLQTTARKLASEEISIALRALWIP